MTAVHETGRANGWPGRLSVESQAHSAEKHRERPGQDPKRPWPSA